MLERSAAAVDDAMGPGAHDVLRQVTLNVGMVRGGLKVNMVPSACEVETDIRLPVGVTRAQVMEQVDRVLAGYPQAKVEEMFSARELR